MAMTGLAIAAALALAKDQLVDKPADRKKRQLAAETQKLSPWTGLKADPVQDSNTMDTMLKYGATGASVGSGYANNQANLALKDQALSNMKLNPYSSAGRVGFNLSDDPFWGKNPYGSSTGV